MRSAAFAAFERTDRVNGEARHGRKLLLREACGFAKRLQLRPKRPRSARFHRLPSYYRSTVRVVCGLCAGFRRVLCVVSEAVARQTAMVRRSEGETCVARHIVRKFV